MDSSLRIPPSDFGLRPGSPGSPIALRPPGSRRRAKQSRVVSHPLGLHGTEPPPPAPPRKNKPPRGGGKKQQRAAEQHAIDVAMMRNRVGAMAPGEIELFLIRKRAAETEKALAQTLPPAETAALRALWDATGGPEQRWHQQRGWDRWAGKGGEGELLHIREWSGVTVQDAQDDESDGFLHVIELSLCGNGLAGMLPSALGQLRKLQVLELSRNALRGAIPEMFRELPDLVELALAGNRLDGELPRSLFAPAATAAAAAAAAAGGGGGGSGGSGGSGGGDTGGGRPRRRENLWKIDLSSNYIGGPLAPPLGPGWAAMPALAHLHLNNNRFVGPVPASLGGAEGLLALRLSANDLSGELPAGLRRCARLKYLELQHNRLGGALPGWLAELRHLQRADVSQNRFDGPLPPLLHRGCPHLKVLRADARQYGDVPPEVRARGPAAAFDFIMRRGAYRKRAAQHVGQLAATDRKQAALPCLLSTDGGGIDDALDGLLARQQGEQCASPPANKLGALFRATGDTAGAALRQAKISRAKAREADLMAFANAYLSKPTDAKKLNLETFKGYAPNKKCFDMG